MKCRAQNITYRSGQFIEPGGPLSGRSLDINVRLGASLASMMLKRFDAKLETFQMRFVFTGFIVPLSHHFLIAAAPPNWMAAASLIHNVVFLRVILDGSAKVKLIQNY